MFVDWMDWVIDIFDTRNIATFVENFRNKSQKNEFFAALMLTWLNDNTKAQIEGRLIDWFGTQYEEMIKSKSKADALGQFYTPMSVSKLMAMCSVGDMDHPENATIDDCACGSGRLLIAAEEALRCKYGYSNKRYFTGADIDHMSVRMCALNLMIAGVCGRVMCRNTLTMETYYGYEINEVRTPIPCNMYSIRKLSKDECGG